MQVIKLYAWEEPMEKVIQDLRSKELALIRQAAFLRTTSDMLNCASPFLVTHQGCRCWWCSVHTSINSPLL